MIIKKNRAVSRLPISAAINYDDYKKFSAFVALLVQIDKRINMDATTKKTRSKKATKSALSKSCREGSQYREPLLFLITHALSFIFDRYKIHNLVNQYDRYNSTSSFSGCLSNY